MFRFYIFILFQIYIKCFQYGQLIWNLTAVNSTISINTNYILSFSISFVAIDLPDYLIPRTSTIQITFPIQYPNSVFNNLILCDSINDQCNTCLNHDPCTITSIKNGNVLTLQNAFAQSSLLYPNNVTITLTMKSIINPSSPDDTDIFLIKVLDSGVQYYSDNTFIFTPSYSQMTCSIMFINSTVQAKNNGLIISLTTVNPVQTNGFVKISFPPRWTMSRYQSNPLFSLLSCKSITNVNSSIICSSSGNNVIARQVFLSTASPQNIVFNLTSIYAPPSLQKIYPIRITTQTSNSRDIDMCIPSVQSTNYNTSLTADFSFSSTAAYKTSYSMTLSVKTAINHQILDQLRIIFPSSIGLQDFFSYFIASNAFYDYNISGNTLSLYPFTSSSSLITPQTIVITLNSIISPPSNRTTGNLNISIYRYGYMMETGLCCSQIVNASGTLVNAKIIPFSYSAGDLTQYNITIKLNGALSVNGAIQIMFPTANYNLGDSNGNCTIIYSTNMSTSAQATCLIVSNVLTIKNIFNATPVYQQAFTVITNLLNNPSKAGVTNNILIRSIYDTTNYLFPSQGYVDSYTLTISYMSSNINNVSISLTSYQVYADNVNLTILISNKNSLNVGSSILIIIPSQFQLGAVNCYYGITILTNSQCSISGNQITLSNIISSSINSNSLNSIIFTNLINPKNCSLTDNFTIFIYDNLNNQIQGWIGSALFMISPNQFKNLSLHPINSTLGVVTTYFFNMTTPFNIPNNSYITINFPKEFKVIGQSCNNYSSNLNALNCSLNSNPISLNLNLATTISTNFYFSITSIQNPISLSVSNIVIALYFNNSITSLSLQYNYNLTQSFTFTPNQITYSLVNLWPYLGQTSTIIFTILTSNLIPPNNYLTVPGYLIINIPTDFNLTSASCSVIFGVVIPICIINSNQLKISGFAYNKSIQIHLNNITNPNSISNIFFSLYTYDNLNNIVDESLVNSTFTLICSGNCRTCLNTSTTTCYSCYNSNPLILPYYLNKYLQLTSCKSQCDIGYFSDSNFICQICPSLCKTCTSFLICQSCISNIYFLNSSCYKSCPLGYYNDTSSTCNTCTTTNCSVCVSAFLGSNCLICQSGFFLSLNSCLISCPLGSYADSNNVCQNCPNNCDSCSINTNPPNVICLTCSNTFILYDGLCWTQCPITLFFDSISNSCISCSSNCFSCQNNPTNCSSCDFTDPTFTYLDISNTCVSICTAGYFPKIGICTLCISPCQTCISQKNCSTCLAITNLVLFNNSCINLCPINISVNISNICILCQSPCLTCSIISTNCTSCNYTLVLSGSTCIVACNSTMVAINNTCQYCASPCNNSLTGCVSSTLFYLCYQCISNYYLYNQSCFSICPSATRSLNCTKCNCVICADLRCNYCNVIQIARKDIVCVPCYQGCANCTNNSLCISCISGYYLYKQSCTINCSSPNFPGVSLGILVCSLCNYNLCTSCIGTTTQCVSCNPGYLFNNITKSCRDIIEGCWNDSVDSVKYYQADTNCLPCQLPCTQCNNSYNDCTSCYAGMYLLEINATFHNCTNTCNIGYYLADQKKCQICYYLCLTCSYFVCYKCINGAYFMKGNCTMQCIQPMPFTKNGICTNCINIQNCLQCSSDQCSQCIQKYLIYSGSCFQSCPDNYQPDLNNTMCIPTSKLANELYLISLSKKRNFPFPFSILFLAFLLSLLISWIQQIKCYYVGSIISVLSLLEFGSWILLLIFIIIYGTQIWYAFYVILGLLFVNLVFNFINLISILKIFHQDVFYNQWRYQKKNSIIEQFIIFISLSSNFKFTRILFSKLFARPFFSARLVSIHKFSFWNKLQISSIFFLQGPFAAIAFWIAINQYQTDSKVFIECLEVIFLTLIGICFNITHLRKNQINFFTLKNDYDPLKNASTRQVKGFSDLGEGQQVQKIKRTRSQGKLDQQKTQFKKVQQDYISVYDPQDYQDVPKVRPKKIIKGIQMGKFRRKNKKKLEDMLEQIPEIPQYETQIHKTKKLNKGKKGKDSVVELLYFRAPPIQAQLKKIQRKKLKDKKRNALIIQQQQIIPQFDEQKIFQTIRNKQSQYQLLSKRQDFDTNINQQKKVNLNKRFLNQTSRNTYFEQQKDITNVPNEYQMSEDQIFQVKQTKRKQSQNLYEQQPNLNDNTNNNIIFSFDPDDLMNTNYAKKNHIPGVISKKQESGRLSRIGGMLLKSLKK